MQEEDLMKRGNSLAELCAASKVPENQLGMVLAHLKRHRRPEATKKLLASLPASPFGRRTGKSRGQYEALHRHVKSALSGVSSWEEAAVIVGWAKRLWSVYKKRTS